MILRALQLIGEKSIGGTLSPDEQTTYLAALNAMMDSWSVDRSKIYQLLQENFALTTSVGSYTIGAGATFNTTRPTRIDDPCFVRDTQSIDRPLELIDAAAYGLITKKNLDGGIPAWMFYDGAFASSLGTIFIYPEPIAGLTLYINSWKQLQQFALISTTLALPPGYERAITYNLAIELAGGFISVSQEVAKIARESLGAIRGFNTPSPISRLDSGVAGSRPFNVQTGTYI
jgi:hypothetical protein